MAERLVSLETIEIEYDGAIARVCLNRPTRRNAASPKMVDEFQEALDRLEDDDAVRVVVIKGRGNTFCSGYDVKAHYTSETGEPEPKRTQPQDMVFNERSARNYMRLWEMHKATIAQVEGYCLGGGLMLAMQCDLVYAASDALIGQPQARSLGMSPEFGMWPLTIGVRQTKELLFTGDVVTGDEAAKLGMVNRAFSADELESYVEWVAARIALTPPDMILFSKLAVNEAAEGMGYRDMVRAAVHANTFEHFLDSNYEFRSQVQTSENVSTATTARDKAYGGIVPRDAAWEAHKKARDAD
jgi:enoyl-CoA hydratase